MEIVQVNYIGSDGQYQTYQLSDKSLINTSFVTPTFGSPNDYVEYHIKDQSGVILSSNYFSNRYKVGSDVDPQTGTTTTVYLDPETDARDAGYDAVIGFSKKKSGDPFLSEVFDVREAIYPSKQGDYRLMDKFEGLLE